MATPAGWYDDPQDQQLIRYFDGTSWTTHTAPRPGAATTSTSTTSTSTTAGTTPAGTGAQASATRPASESQTAYPQAQQGWQSKQQEWQAQQAQSQSRQAQQPAGATQPPTQPQSPTAGFQFGGAQRVPTADATPSPGTPRSVKIGILAAFLACVALFGVGYLLSDRSASGGLTASDLGLEDGFGCTQMADEYVGLSSGDADPSRLVSADGGIEKRNEIGTVKAPTGSGQNLVLSCTYPTAVWGDGAETRLLLELRVDKDLGLYIGAEAR